jgi:chlorophyll/bacteriochlorophyll a synthase
MGHSASSDQALSAPALRPAPSAVLELMKPITWFPPVWAFACGIVSSGVATGGRWPDILLGLLLAGPLLCATSQVVNDWFDRHVDAINEPHRPIPSGRIPGRWGLYLGIFWTIVSLAVAALLGPWVFAAALAGAGLAWAYSAPPIRLKRNGWLGNAAAAFSYEGLPWFTGAAVMLGAAPDWRILALALLYALGAHGMMTLNDFKAIEGDRVSGIDSLPVLLGPARAARLACLVMAAPQVVVIALLAAWGFPLHAAIIGALLAAQLWLMRTLLADPKGRAPWYNQTGILLSVLGMMVAAQALGSAA